jgi:hypothetical protein
MGSDPSHKAYPGLCRADGTCIKKPPVSGEIALPP